VLAPHDHPAGAAAVARPSSTGQRAHPAGAGLARGGGPDQAAQLLGQAARRPWSVVREIEEMAQIGDEPGRI
jgi:hypothetical protein